MPFSFRRFLRIGPIRVGVTKNGVRSVSAGRVRQSRGKTLAFRLPTGIRGLTFRLGGKSRRKR